MTITLLISKQYRRSKSAVISMTAMGYFALSTRIVPREVTARILCSEQTSGVINSEMYHCCYTKFQNSAQRCLSNL